MEPVRTFVALELPEAAVQTLAGVIDRLSRLQDRVRWTRPEGMHLTLKFLGDVEAEKVPEVVDAVGKVAGKAAPFSLHTAEIGGFPGEDRARVVWVGVGGDLDALTGLQAGVEAALSPLGFPPERRRFFPHLTLGRARRNPVAVPPEPAGSVRSPDFRVERVTVMKSDLRPGGAVYTALGYGRLKVRGQKRQEL